MIILYRAIFFYFCSGNEVVRTKMWWDFDWRFDYLVNVDLSYMKYAFRIVNIIIILVRIGLLGFLSSIDIKITNANLASLSAVPIFF